MYCVKCKKITETDREMRTTTKNNRNMKRGRCVVCGSTKTQFIKGVPTGGNILNNIINKLPFEMHLPGHNFTGPGTKLGQRLQNDLTPQSWSKPINKVDAAAYHHDVCYLKNRDTSTRNKVCDKEMINELDGIMNPSLRERLDKSIVKKIIGSKMKFGMGVVAQQSVFKKLK